MNEIYWMTRVGAIYDIGTVMTGVSALCLGLSPILFMMMEDDDMDWFKPKVMLKWLVGMLITGLLIISFVPTKKDMYLIYGLGTLVDYAKNNEKVKEIPDKAVDAILDWMNLNDKENNK